MKQPRFTKGDLVEVEGQRVRISRFDGTSYHVYVIYNGQYERRGQTYLEAFGRLIEDERKEGKTDSN